MGGTYWQRLKRHPGVPVAIACQGMGFIAGFTRPDGDLKIAFIGMAIMSVFWIPVLITARK